MKPQFYQPAAPLRNYIRYYMISEISDIITDKSRLDVFADVYPRLVFQHNEGVSGLYIAGRSMPKSYLTGLKTQPLHFEFDCTSIIVISFYPDAVKVLFGVDCGELLNEHPDFASIGSDPLTEFLESCRNSALKLEALDTFFLRKLSNSKRTFDPLVYAAVRELQIKTTTHRVQSLHHSFLISERQLERKFRSNLGLTPKQFLRVKRFEKAISSFSCSQQSLTQFALGLDYYDQSHFIKEFKEFSGLTPKHFRDQNIISSESNAILS